MWLIKTDDFTLHGVQDGTDEHPYAILSHTWDEVEDGQLRGEITFQDIQDITKARNKSGWAKIAKTCEVARNCGLDWAWIDTCCIDKTSSAELTEAINSMFQWYQQAKICFVYLSDLPQSPSTDIESRASREHLNDFFPRSRWLTRGWTLQELIAPQQVEFYDRAWTKRGTKASLEKLISTSTGIEVDVLSDSTLLPTIPVATRMCWASRRKTKRVEDAAYSLLGIFNVNMPLIYGEGQKAFLRLQDAITQQSDDLTLFAWCTDDDMEIDKQQKYHGVFAQSPRDFRKCTHIVPIWDPLINGLNTFTSTNCGLRFQASLSPSLEDGGYLMNLYCYNREIELSGDKRGVLALRLIKTPTGFVRHRCQRLVVASEVSSDYIWPGHPTYVNIPKQITSKESQNLDSRFTNAFKFNVQCPRNVDVDLIARLGSTNQRHVRWQSDSRNEERNDERIQTWDTATWTFFTGGGATSTVMVWPLVFDTQEPGKWARALRILCGFDTVSSGRPPWRRNNGTDLKPWACIIFDQNKSIEGVDGDSNLANTFYSLLEDKIANSEPYGPTVSSLGRQIATAISNGSMVPSKVLLKARAGSAFEGKKKPDEVNMMLAVHLEDVIVSGFPVHKVVLTLQYDEPAVRRTSKGTPRSSGASLLE